MVYSRTAQASRMASRSSQNGRTNACALLAPDALNPRHRPASLLELLLAPTEDPHHPSELTLDAPPLPLEQHAVGLLTNPHAMRRREERLEFGRRVRARRRKGEEREGELELGEERRVRERERGEGRGCKEERLLRAGRAGRSRLEEGEEAQELEVEVERRVLVKNLSAKSIAHGKVSVRSEVEVSSKAYDAPRRPAR